MAAILTGPNLGTSIRSLGNRWLGVSDWRSSRVTMRPLKLTSELVELLQREGSL